MNSLEGDMDEAVAQQFASMAGRRKILTLARDGIAALGFPLGSPIIRMDIEEVLAAFEGFLDFHTAEEVLDLARAVELERREEAEYDEQCGRADSARKLAKETF